MRKAKSILAVDVGATSLKIAEFSYPDGKIVIEKYSYIEYDKTNAAGEERLKLLDEAFSSTIRTKNYKSKQVYLSISGESTFIRFSKLPPTSYEKEKVHQLVVQEAKQNIPYPMEKVTWSYQLFEEKNGSENEIKVMFAVVKNAIIEKIISIIEKNKFDVKIVDVSPAACFNVATANKIGEKGCSMILDIGGTTSTLVFIDNKSFYARNIPIAGQAITQQISRKLNIPFERAEKLKKEVGSLDLNEGEEPKSEEETEVLKIIKSVWNRLYEDINRSVNVYKSQQNGNTPSKLYLAGASSVIKFTPQLLTTKLKIPTEYFNPLKHVMLSYSINKKELSGLAHTATEVVGLGLRKFKSPVEISLLPEHSIKKQNLKTKSLYFLAAACIILLSLGLISWGVNSGKKQAVELVNSLRNETSIMENRLNLMSSQLQKLDKAKERFNIAANYLNERNIWINVLNTIQKCLPDNTWIVELSVKEEKPTKQAKQTRRSLFGKAQVKAKAEASDNQGATQWIVIKGHSLVLSKIGKISFAEKFKKNLLKSKIFSGNSGNVIITDFKTDPEESNNIDTFQMKIKLQKKLHNLQ